VLFPTPDGPQRTTGRRLLSLDDVLLLIVRVLNLVEILLLANGEAMDGLQAE
jgi:hypothetical protein